jgi:hypothetical protein
LKDDAFSREEVDRRRIISAREDAGASL